MLSTPGWNHSTHLLGSSPRLWKAALNTEGDVPAIALAVQVTPPGWGNRVTVSEWGRKCLRIYFTDEADSLLEREALSRSILNSPGSEFSLSVSCVACV